VPTLYSNASGYFTLLQLEIAGIDEQVDIRERDKESSPAMPATLPSPAPSHLLSAAAT
jgi:hypothetical protein